MNVEHPRAVLSVEHGGRAERFDTERVSVGRDAGCDVVVEDPSASRHHLSLERTAGGWELVDSSSGGTWVEGRRVDRLRLGPAPVRLSLGSAQGAVVVVSQTVPAPPPSPPPPPPSGVALAGPPPVVPSPPDGAGPPPGAQAVLPPGQLPHHTSMLPPGQLPGGTVTIGRDRSNAIVLDDPLVSRFHARLEIGSPHLGRPSVVHDLGSFNGSFVNGLRVRGSAWLEPGSELVVGNQTFRWDGVQLLATATTHEFTLYADGLSVVVQDSKVLLDNVSFQLDPSTLTAIIGPSGAGKSTLLGALTGLRPATHGRVIWQGHDLYAAYDQLRFQIGLVPQQDIQHPQLKVRQALGYAAELRLPPDTSPAERDARVRFVAEQLQLTPRLDNRIGTQLSGGQKKRVSIATELLTAPPLLFLDEPTSGLDPGLDLEVMRQLRRLADDGRVVAVVTHSVLALDVCDNVMVLAPGGRIAYFGPPSGVLEHFGCANYPAVFDMLDDHDLWQRIPLPRPSTETQQLQPVRTPVPSAPMQSFGRQLLTLLRRNAAVVMADRLLLGMLISLPLVLGLLSRIVPGHAGLSLDAARVRPRLPDGSLAGFVYDSTEARQRLIVLIVAAALMGVAMTIRELVGERPIFRREYAVGLSPGVYLTSKLCVLGAASFVQGVFVTIIATVGLPGADGASGTFRVMLTIGFLTFTMGAVGLLLSALVTSTEQTMPALVGTIMVQLVLSGALFPVNGRPLLAQFAWLAPARWGYGAAAGAMGLNRTAKADEKIDWIASAGAGHWIFALFMLAVLCAATIGAGLLAVRRSASASS